MEVLLETILERACEVIPPVMVCLETSEKGVILRRPASQLHWVVYVLSA